MAKKTTKYSLKRSDIEAKINSVVGKLEDLDTYELSPRDVTDIISEVVDELETLASESSNEA